MRYFVTGYVTGTHGLDGLLKVKSASGSSEHIMRLQQVVLRNGETEKTYSVESAQGLGTDVLLKVQGVDTKEDAVTLKGCEVVVSEDEAHKCASGEWYVDDLCGLCVMYGEDKVGTVADVIEGGAGNLLAVDVNEECAILEESMKHTSKGKKRQVMVPFSEEHIGEVDVAHKQLQLRHLWVLE